LGSLLATCTVTTCIRTRASTPTHTPWTPSLTCSTNNPWTTVLWGISPKSQWLSPAMVSVRAR
jgi:hypothetical protein